MTVFVSHTTVDCHDAYALSEWWREVLAYEMDPDDPNEPGHEECLIRDPGTGHTLLFIEVPDAELPAKRIHLDVRPRERVQDEEVAWLLERGAELVADRRGIYGPGSGWVTLADPEGNQFCVLRSQAELGGVRPG
ncbi:MAG: glyoxalase [Acidobacteria bacterium]|nr:MAG: glyoxalase [Acidobacteriota bacterium]